MKSRRDHNRLAESLTSTKLKAIHLYHWISHATDESRSYLAIPQVSRAQVVWNGMRGSAALSPMHQSQLHTLSLNFGANLSSLRLDSVRGQVGDQFESSLIQRCSTLRELVLLRRLPPSEDPTEDHYLFPSVLDIAIHGPMTHIDDISGWVRITMFPSLRRVVFLERDWTLLGRNAQRKVVNEFPIYVGVEDKNGVVISS